MNGLTGMKDVDSLIIKDLDDRSLLNLCLVKNTCLYNLLQSENFWQNKSISAFGPDISTYKPDNLSWKKFYMDHCDNKIMFGYELRGSCTISYLKHELTRNNHIADSAKLYFKGNQIYSFSTNTPDNITLGELLNIPKHKWLENYNIYARKMPVLPEKWNIKLYVRVTHQLTSEDEADYESEDDMLECNYKLCPNITIKLDNRASTSRVGRLLESILYSFGRAHFYYVDSENCFTEETHDLNMCFDAIKPTGNKLDIIKVHLFFETPYRPPIDNNILEEAYKSSLNLVKLLDYAKN